MTDSDGRTFRNRAESARYDAWERDTEEKQLVGMVDALVLAVLSLNEPTEATEATEAPKQCRNVEGLRIFGDSAEELESKALEIARDIFGPIPKLYVGNYTVLLADVDIKKSGGKKYYARISVEVIT